MKKITFLALFFLCFSLNSQTIDAYIFDKNTSEPLFGTTIYIDGTTIGTTTNSEGYFELDLKNSKNSNLIISFLGYQTQVFEVNSSQFPKNIYLEESESQLDEVIVEPDNWSRERKLRIFKSEFLGKTEASKYCKIINEKDITLIYKASSNTLIAYSEKPIIIKNKYLGYQINYNLMDFEIKFNYDTMGLLHTHKVYYVGTSYFTELHKKTKKKVLKNRANEYYGSLLHFMRSLANKRLSENKFRIFDKSFQIPTYKYFDITREDNQTQVTLLKKKLNILYDQFDQSSIQLQNDNTKFLIDEFGNYSPPNNLIFGGNLGKKRVSNMLPLNFEIK